MGGKIRKTDFNILEKIQSKIRSRRLDWIMPKITVLGSMGAVWVILAVFMIIAGEHKECGITIIIGLFSGVVIGNVIIKNLVQRSRPCWIKPISDMLINIPKDYSFPSGHTLSSFIAAAIMLHYDRNLGLIAFVIAAAIAFSRAYLYVHFPTDIIAGAALGIIIGMAVVSLTQRFIFNAR